MKNQAPLPGSIARGSLFLAALALLLASDSPAFAQRSKVAPRVAAIPYHAVYMKEDGSLDQTGLDQVLSAVKAESDGKPVQVLVLVHGYNTSVSLGRKQYRAIARSIRAEAGSAGWLPVVVGVHWASHPGKPTRWLPQMLGYRFLSAAGFPNAVRNPYLEKVKVAVVTGRIGFRTLLFRLKEELPGTPVHVFAHSMGCEVVLRALVPGSGASLGGGPIESPSFEPERKLELGMVVLAGADLDQDAFLPAEENTAAEALDRVRLWWITVPKRNSADAALELRRAAGRRDAMGNVGLALTRVQFETLVARRGLLIDNRRVPIAHDLTDYFPRDRIQSLATALRYLQNPESPEGKTCILAILDKILKADPTQLPAVVNVNDAGARLYVRWRLEGQRTGYGAVKIVPETGKSAPAALRR